MHNKQPDFSEPMRELGSFLYFIFTASWLLLLGAVSFLIFIVGPIVLTLFVAFFLARGVGLLH